MNSITKYILTIVLTTIVVGGGTYLAISNNAKSNRDALQTNTATASPTTSATPDPTTGLKTYTSKVEGFTLKYPSNWVFSSGTQGVPVVEWAQFKAPDGLIVVYAGTAKYSDTTIGGSKSDFAGCGQQSVCETQNVLSVDSFTVPNHGSVELVKSLLPTYYSTDTQIATDRSCFKIDLHEPSGPSTTPKVGANSYKDHAISYSLLSKNGFRFGISTINFEVPSTTSGPVYTFKCAGLTQSQFFAKASVQQAETILRSLSY